MKISSILITLAIFSGLSIGLSSFYFDLGSTYGKTDITNISYFNRTAEISSFTAGVQQNVSNSQPGITTTATSAGLIWGVLQQMMSLPSIFLGPNSLQAQAQIALVDAGLDLPDWPILMIGSIIVIVILLAVVAFFRGGGEV